MPKNDDTSAQGRAEMTVEHHGGVGVGDPVEVREWEDALDDVLRHFGAEQAAYLWRW